MKFPRFNRWYSVFSGNPRLRWLLTPPKRGIEYILRNAMPDAELVELLDSQLIAKINPDWKMETDQGADYVTQDVVSNLIRGHGVARVRRISRVRYALPETSAPLAIPLALLQIPPEHTAYLKIVGDKTRNMIRKSSRSGYKYGMFDWNTYIDDIYEINTSKEVRSLGPMTGWYSHRPSPRQKMTPGENYRYCFGAFIGDKLVGYVFLIRCGNLGFIRHIMGHGDHLRFGVMNGLLSWAVEECIRDGSMRWLNYGGLRKGDKDGVSSFKRHCGFKAYIGLVDLVNHSALRILGDSQRRKTHTFI